MGTAKEQVEQLRDRVRAKRALPRRKGTSEAARLDSSLSQGIPPSGTDAPITARPTGDPVALYKELSDKLAWSVGSTLGMRYGKRSRIELWATRLASAVVERFTQMSNGEKV